MCMNPPPIPPKLIIADLADSSLTRRLIHLDSAGLVALYLLEAITTQLTSYIT